MEFKKISNNSKEEASSIDTIQLNNADEILLTAHLVSITETKPLVIWNTDIKSYKVWDGTVFVNLSKLTLSQVLLNGNKTSNGQIIQALNGDGILDLRANNTDGEVHLKSGNTGFQIISGISAQFSNNIDNTAPISSNVSISTFGTFIALTDISNDKSGIIGVVSNEFFTWSFDADRPAYPSNLGTQKGTYVQGVINSAVIGGKYVTLKTDNTAYCNQIGFNKPNSLYEVIVDSKLLTQDRIQKLQDKDGIIALLTDTQKFYQFFQGTGTEYVGQTTIPLMNQQANVFETYIEKTFLIKNTDNYKIDLSFISSLNVTYDDFIALLDINDGTTTETLTIQTEPKDSVGTGILVDVIQGGAIQPQIITSTNQRNATTFTFNRQLVEGVTYTFSLRFGCDNANRRATMYQAQVMIEQKTLIL